MTPPSSDAADRSFEFTLLVEGPSFTADDVVETLFEAGCDDGLLNEDNGVQTIDFDREATSLQEAVLSAIADVESVDDFHVVRVIDIDLLSMSTIAGRVGRSRESIRLFAKESRGPGGFPPPVNRHDDGRYHLWRWADVARWFVNNRIDGVDHLDDGRNRLTAINAALDLRALGHSLEPEERAELRRLVDQGLAA